MKKIVQFFPHTSILYLLLIVIFIALFAVLPAPGAAQDRQNRQDTQETQYTQDTHDTQNAQAGQTVQTVQTGQNDNKRSVEIAQEVRRLMEAGDIPGLTLVIVDNRDSGSEAPAVFIQGYGYADLGKKTPVTADTLFELGSCSKAFTALAALKCRTDGLLNFEADVSHYIPGFHTLYEGKTQKITLKQCLHHTSGIPFESISLIPETEAANALQQTVQRLNGTSLKTLPGTQYEYATINYDVLGAVIERVTKKSFETFLQQDILVPLGLQDTFAGVNQIHPPENMAVGYKAGFFTSFKYTAPVFRGNIPAGYVVSNGNDMARWLKIQMGLAETPLAGLVEESHRIDADMPFNNQKLNTYTYGWQVALERLRLIEHGGDNPNFSSYIIFNPVDQFGVVILANMRSGYTPLIARTVMNYLDGKGFLAEDVQDNTYDKGSSIVSLMLGFFCLAILAFIIMIFIDLARGRRQFAPLNLGRGAGLLLTLLAYVPFLIGIYLVPRTMAGVSMETALVFSAYSFTAAILVILAALGLGYIALVLSTLFPHRNKYLKSAPLLFVLSLLSGGANAVVIFLITTSIFSRASLLLQVYNFFLAFFVYIIGRKVLQTRLILVTYDVIYDLRMRLLEKVFYTSFEKFEKIRSGRVYATLNDDTGEIGNSAAIIVRLVTSMVTVVGAFLYLATIAFWATAVTLLVIASIATLYGIVTKKARVYFEAARDTRNTYMELLNGLIAGFKELSLQYNKKKEYKKDIGNTVDEFRKKMSIALIKFTNAFLIGESLLIIILGAVGYGIPRLFPAITPVTLMAFVMILLYLIGPINAILNAVPSVMQMRVAWNRIQGFIRDVPANMDPKYIESLNHGNPGTVERIEAKGLSFAYESPNEGERFTVGPLDFEAKKGEVVFIIGGNGSGKTTLAKLLTGLYKAEEGIIKINDETVNMYQLGEYYSTVFGDYHLFNKLYNVDLGGKEKEIQDYLKMLHLEEKVKLEGNAFSTINLSGGQRKRLALLQCYLEDRPIYLFDEIAADQDPTFRKFFYRELLQRMKEKGKIVIAITHDDHYFDVADKIVKMDMGKVDLLVNEEQKKLTVTK